MTIKKTKTKQEQVEWAYFPILHKTKQQRKLTEQPPPTSEIIHMLPTFHLMQWHLTLSRFQADKL